MRVWLDEWPRFIEQVLRAKEFIAKRGMCVWVCVNVRAKAMVVCACVCARNMRVNVNICMCVRGPACALKKFSMRASGNVSIISCNLRVTASARVANTVHTRAWVKSVSSNDFG